ncbi:MAG: nucleotidyltransferase family protein [Pseudomonadota bacterium]
MADDLTILATLMRPSLGLPVDDAQQTLVTDGWSDADRRAILLRKARRAHRVAALLRPEAFGGDGGAQALAGDRKNHITSHLQKQAVWRSLTELLDAHHIRYWGVKGQRLGEQFYPEPAHRQAKDIDIVIDPSDYAAAIALLTERGYRAKAHRRFGNRSSRLAAIMAKDVVLSEPRHGVIIEVHRRLLYIEAMGFTEHVLAGQPPGEFIDHYQPGPQLYLLLHGALSLWNRLKLVADISLLLRRLDRTGLDALLDHAAAWRCRDAIISSLALTEQLFPGSLAADAAARVAALLGESKVAQAQLRRYRLALRGSELQDGRPPPWQRAEFPTAAWYIYPEWRMRAFLTAYVPVAAFARMVL